MKQSKLRFHGDGSAGQVRVWEKREEDWRVFWKSQGGKEGFAKSGDVVVGGAFTHENAGFSKFLKFSL